MSQTPQKRPRDPDSAAADTPPPSEAVAAPAISAAATVGPAPASSSAVGPLEAPSADAPAPASSSAVAPLDAPSTAASSDAPSSDAPSAATAADTLPGAPPAVPAAGDASPPEASPVAGALPPEFSAASGDAPPDDPVPAAAVAAPAADPSADLHPPAPKRRAAAHEVVFRIVVPSRQAGAVIGKGGCRINQIRADSGAMIKIADAFAQHEERVIIISSRDDECAISNAENALYSIASLIVKETSEANTIRLLISGSQAGCLIGVSGQNIKHMRNDSGADIKILAPDELLSCASAHDRVVQVSGNIREVLEGLQKVASKLRENPPKKVMPIKQCYSETTSYQFSKLPPSSADLVTSEMMIMEKLVGGLVGRKGYNISRIRNESGATIKVSGVRGEGEHRWITFEGTAQQVSAARMMVENYISSITLQ